MKICNGPLHRGQEIPLENFRLFKSGPKEGKYSPRCERCRLEMRKQKYHEKTGGGYVPSAALYPFLLELVQRVGYIETHRRTGLGKTTIRKILHQERKGVQRRTFQLVAYHLRQSRASNEYRHRDSIQSGASQRGRPEKPVLKPDDYSRFDRRNTSP